MSVEVFLGEDVEPIQHLPAVKHLIEGFKHWKNTGDPGKLFGRDVITRDPRICKEEKVYHAHILEEKEFKIKRMHLRTEYDRTSDACIFYCQGLCRPDYYLILAIVWNDAHWFLDNRHDQLRAYGKEAEDFRNAN
ncbi:MULTISPECIES: type II toxin-antitoxin system YafO family toxin [unclassified Hahella]|uniref:type II toxin-antitoxin system YafO family toxin n=1 Tax=unclassified Hahella TaxID=2624107 RepID=UPI0013E37B6A|nr:MULTISPECIES: type II toxin-antitoxin system YafO family toxin [unclassified Hahella]MBU6954558.1 type II toxin-antitoxin system YafO family toxin [Hahella sp. HN01]